MLDFDHVTGDKFANVKQMVTWTISRQRIFDEIAKCEVRCANCHRRKTYRNRDWEKRYEKPVNSRAPDPRAIRGKKLGIK